MSSRVQCSSGIANVVGQPSMARDHISQSFALSDLSVSPHMSVELAKLKIEYHGLVRLTSQPNAPTLAMMSSWIPLPADGRTDHRWRSFELFVCVGTTHTTRHVQWIYRSRHSSSSHECLHVDFRIVVSSDWYYRV